MTTLVSPSGERFDVIWLRPFCRQHGLDSGNMARVVNGERHHHKGWRLAKRYSNRKPWGIERYGVTP